MLKREGITPSRSGSSFVDIVYIGTNYFMNGSEITIGGIDVLEHIPPLNTGIGPAGGFLLFGFRCGRIFVAAGSSLFHRSIFLSVYVFSKRIAQFCEKERIRNEIHVNSRKRKVWLYAF